MLMTMLKWTGVIWFGWWLSFASLSCEAVPDEVPELDKSKAIDLKNQTHPMDVNWEGRRDFWYLKFEHYMTTKERTRYLNTPRQQRWQLYHERFMLFQRLDNLLKPVRGSMPREVAQSYYRLRTMEEARQYLRQRGYLSSPASEKKDKTSEKGNKK